MYTDCDVFCVDSCQRMLETFTFRMFSQSGLTTARGNVDGSIFFFPTGDVERLNQVSVLPGAPPHPFSSTWAVSRSGHMLRGSPV